jgi:hypothetical protein
MHIRIACNFRREAVMLRARSSFAILAVFTLAIAVHAQPADRVDVLVRKLGSESFVQREKARKELITLGPSTLDALRRGVKSAEPETGRRIADLIAHFEEQLLTQKILTPKMIDLKLEGVSVQDAIAEIGKKSGYPVQFLGDATPFAKKKITLTGKMAFWEAVDRLCEQAGLMEQPIESVPMVNPYYSRRPNPYLVQPQPVQTGPLKLTVRPTNGVPWTEKKVRFDVNGKTWHDAIVWFCNQTKMPLTGKIPAPKGAVRYPDGVDKDGKPREVTLAEVYDIFNDLLAEQELVLLRNHTTLSLIPKNEPRRAPRVALEDLPNRAKTEIVEVVVRLQGDVKAGEFAPHVKRLLGEFASVTPIPEINSLIVVADVFSIRRQFAGCPNVIHSARTSRAGSIKTEARITRDPETKSLIVTLTAGIEPSLHNGQIVGRPVITKLADEQGRQREPLFSIPSEDNFAMEKQLRDLELAYFGPSRVTHSRATTFRVKDDGSKSIAELAGSLTMQVDLQNVVLARMEKIMDAAGKSVAGANGGSLKVQSIKKHAYNTIEVQVTMENLTPNPLGNVFIGGGNVIIRGNVVINGGNIRVNGNGNARDIPDLLDAKGQKFRVNSVTNDSFNINNGNASRNVTILYQAVGDQEPRELVLFGSRTHIIGVPFRFENVPVR